MSFNATLHLECDGCSVEEDLDLEKGDSPEDACDKEGWFFTGTLLDRLLCGDCYEKEEG